MSTVAQQLGAEFFFPGAATVRCPIAAQIANLTRPREVWQLRQRLGENGLAALSIVRRAEGPANRMIDKGGTRRRNPAHDVVSRADDQGWNAPAFDHMGDETDGLMAKRSVGNEQRRVDLGAH